MKVVVTGAAGYIGSIAVERLLLAGHDVVALDSLYRGHKAAIAVDAEFVQVDLRDAALTAKAVRESRADAVMHFAAATLVGESVERPLDYFEVNVVGGHNLIAAAISAGIPRFVFSSTAAVYGIPESIPIAESAPLQPINPYGRS